CYRYDLVCFSLFFTSPHSSCFLSTAPPTTEIYTLSLHDALPISVSSTDTGPALMALGARVRLVSRSGEREVLLSDLYNNDGIDYIKRRPDEILAEVLLDSLQGWKSTYWKLRRRGSFDFPVLSVAAAARLSRDKVVEGAHIVVGAAACQPLAA